VDVKLKAFLDLIAFSEGTSTNPWTQNNGYDVIVDGINSAHIFISDARHPFELGGSVLVRLGPPPLYSTAAGRYQLLARYWLVYKKQLNLPDFSPASQDIVALQQIHERHADVMIEAGNIAGAIKACSNIWASFPGNDYGEAGGHTMAALLAEYQKLLSI
jgi:muramidase (phage lysozyme)